MRVNTYSEYVFTTLVHDWHLKCYGKNDKGAACPASSACPVPAFFAPAYPLETTRPTRVQRVSDAAAWTRVTSNACPKVQRAIVSFDNTPPP